MGLDMGQAGLQKIDKHIKALQAIIPHDTAKDREIHIRDLTIRKLQKEKILSRRLQMSYFTDAELKEIKERAKSQQIWSADTVLKLIKNIEVLNEQIKSRSIGKTSFI